MFTLKFTNRFKKSYKLMVKQGNDISLLDEVIEALRIGKTLDAKYKDHQLTGNFRLFRECHIKPDWLLIYMVEDDVLTLTLVDTVFHSNLLKL